MSANVESKGAMAIEIHPLVVLSIADHSARLKASAGTSFSKKRALGLLFGIQDGRAVKVLECVELAHKENKDGTIELGDEESKATAPIATSSTGSLSSSSTTSSSSSSSSSSSNSAASGSASASAASPSNAIWSDIKLYTASYPNFECLGWYSTGPKPHANDIQLHKRFQRYNERPIYLLLDDSNNAASELRDLPIRVYEESVQVAQEKATAELVKAHFTISADEAERISMIHCAKVIESDRSASTSSSSLLSNHATLIKAMQSLQSRLIVILNYVKSVERGELAADQGILRDIKAVIQRLPVMDQTEARHALHSELNDALLTSLLSSITRSSSALSDLNGRFAISQQPSKRDRHGGMGLGMSGEPDGGFISRVMSGFGGLPFFHP